MGQKCLIIIPLSTSSIRTLKKNLTKFSYQRIYIGLRVAFALVSFPAFDFLPSRFNGLDTVRTRLVWGAIPPTGSSDCLSFGITPRPTTAAKLRFNSGVIFHSLCTTLVKITESNEAPCIQWCKTLMYNFPKILSRLVCPSRTGIYTTSMRRIPGFSRVALGEVCVTGH